MKKFTTYKTESLSTLVKRLKFNLYAAYRRTGARISFISSDFKEIHIKLGLNWTSKNYVGSVSGGSMYGALDPIFMVQLINILGPNYIVWDKEAQVNFVRPIKNNVRARFIISDELLMKIIKVTDWQNEIEHPVQFVDDEDIIYAVVTKKIYIAEKDII